MLPLREPVAITNVGLSRLLLRGASGVLVPKVRRAMVLEGGAFQKFSSVFLLQARAAPIPKNAEDARSSLPCWKGEMRRRNGRQRC
ncbi:hypothetical protein LSM04_003737 [Trypanosoma melophagium]|uniref:uncharacterized protein n=1 Tax=Trypanosoma melophagium TaxID=715481 RepID=UPI003519EDA3|nr:hypothetical protein LSM04_003737 [Trypanosoma melophagium]